jgi:hypothetical protein
MISQINESPVRGAACMNCKNEMDSEVVASNAGKQTHYWCKSTNCPRVGMLTVNFFPPEVLTPTARTEAPAKLEVVGKA